MEFVATSASARLEESMRISAPVYRPPAISLPDPPEVRFVLGGGLSADVDFSADYQESYYISGELRERYWLVIPLPVRVRIEGGEFVADQPSLGLHAFGESPIAALLSLRDVIVEEYEFLQRMQDRLAPRLGRQLGLLRELLIVPDA